MSLHQDTTLHSRRQRFGESNGQLKGRSMPRARVKIIILRLEQAVHVYALFCLECTFRTARGNRLTDHLTKKQPNSQEVPCGHFLEQAGAKKSQ